MAITQFTPMDAIKLAINSAGVDANLITDTRYAGFVVGHALSTSQTYTFQQVATGYYTLIGYGGLCLLTVGTPYTETNGVSSTLHCGWDDTAPSVVVTAGTQTGDTLSVTATPIDYRATMVDICRMLKSQAARDGDQMHLQGAGSGFTTLMERLDTLEQQYRGGFYA
jgi:hypothetical protein